MSVILTILLIAKVGSGNQTGINYVDLLELNHVKDQYTQILMWDWDHQYRRHNCQGFVLVEMDQCPVRKVGAYYEVDVSRRGKRLVLRSRAFFETWTQLDPERENQKVWPVERRRKMVLID